MKKVAIVGAGLAGSEAAWILANGYGMQVSLFEMKLKNPTPAQDRPDLFAELVCSNGLKSMSVLNPAGVLKLELAQMDSLVMRCAWEAKVPAGESLAVDRERFSGAITQQLRNHKNITVHDEIVHGLCDIEAKGYDKIIVATGPLTHDDLARNLQAISGSESLYFYDAIAPILDGDSIDMTVAFLANRETKTTRLTNCESSDGDYLNLPLSKEEYSAFVQALVEGEKLPFHNFEEPKFFNGCQPIEVLAASGPMTLMFGPLKGKGLTDPRTGRWPFACVQLRKETLGHSAYNMVGFQTRLTWPAQRNVFRSLPGLANAEFHRLGSMHRNTYLIAPKVLNQNFSLKNDPNVHLAGQVMGVEGYLESTAMGNLVAHVVGHELQEKSFQNPPKNTALGSLAAHVLHCPEKEFSPMNIHWGLFDELSEQELNEHYSLNRQAQNSEKEVSRRAKLDKSTKRQLLSNRASALFVSWRAAW